VIASMDSSLRRLLSGVIDFFVLLNTRSHSADIAGIANVSKAAQVVDEAIRSRESRLGHNDTESMK
jgi:hypothetical protein